MVHLNVHGNAYVGKFRSEGEIVQLGLLDPTQVRVELSGQRITYTLSRTEGVTTHGPEDVLHVKAMSADGLAGMSPVTLPACALAEPRTFRSTRSSTSRRARGRAGS